MKSRRDILLGGSATSLVAAAALAQYRIRIHGPNGVFMPPDTTPDDFSASWPGVFGAGLSQAYFGPAVTPVGYNGPTSFACTGALTVQINGTGAYVSSGSLNPGQTLTPKITSSGSNLTAVTGTINFNSGALIVPWSVTTAAGAGTTTVSLQPNQSIEYDLSTLLSGFNDVGNDIVMTVIGAAGVLVAKPWLMKTSTGGDASRPYVKRQLLDLFGLTLGAAANGDTFAITFDGYTGPNGGGSFVTQTLSVVCDTTPPTTWSMGALTRAFFGGMPIHQFFGGNAQSWTMTQTVANQLMLIFDPTARTEINSGRTYSTGYCRLVPKATSGGTGFTGQPAGYGAAPLVALNSATPNVVTLTNTSTGLSFTVTVSYVAGQKDVSSWPLYDGTGVTTPPNGGSTPVGTTQLAYSMRIKADFVYGNKVYLEDGDYLVEQYGQQWGFTPGFGTSPMIGTAPTGVFAGNSFVFSPNPAYANCMEIRARTYLGAYIQNLSINTVNMTSTTLAWRFHNLRLAAWTCYNFTTGGKPKISITNHCDFVNLSAPSNVQSNIQMYGNGAAIISNWIRGALVYTGQDILLIGNRFERPYMVQTFGAPPLCDPQQIFDVVDCGSSTINSNDASPIATIAFNIWINNLGSQAPVHEDLWQWTNSGTPTTTNTTIASPLTYGNIFHPGQRSICDGSYCQLVGTNIGKNLPSCAEIFFAAPLNTNTLFRWMFAYNFADESVKNGFWLWNPASGSRIRRNMCLDDLSNTNKLTDPGYVDKPTLILDTYKSTTSPAGNWTASQNAGIVFEENLTSNTFFDYGAVGSGGVPMQSNLNNLHTYTGANQTTDLVNPAIGSGAYDINDVVAAFTPKTGVTVVQNPFSHTDIIDFRRQVADPVQLF